MFTWICPKCGTEVPPSYSECPKCSTASAEVKPAQAGEAQRPEATAPPASTPAKPAGSPPSTAAAAAPAPKQRAGRPWLQSLIGALAMLVIVMAVLVVVRSGALQRRAPAPTGLAALENVGGTAQADPVLKNIEITGFRLSEEKDRKPMLRFVVVNHSAADLGDVRAKADLRARTSASTDEPVASFEFTTRLGPYEAQDIRVPLTTKLRAYELPDWQLLRADVSRQ